MSKNYQHQILRVSENTKKRQPKDVLVVEVKSHKESLTGAKPGFVAPNHSTVLKGFLG